MPKINLTGNNPNNNSPQENLQRLTQNSQEINDFLKSFNPFQTSFMNDVVNKLDEIIELLESKLTKITKSNELQKELKNKNVSDKIQEKQKTQNISEQIKEKKNELNFKNKLLSFISTINTSILQIPKTIFGSIQKFFQPLINMFSSLFGFLNKYIFKSQWFRWIFKSGQLLFKWLYKYVILSIWKLFLKPVGFFGKILGGLGGVFVKVFSPILGKLFSPLQKLLSPISSVFKKMRSVVQKPFISLFTKKKPTIQDSILPKKGLSQLSGQLSRFTSFIKGLGSPRQLLGQVTLILIQVQLRILRPIIEKFLLVQGNVLIKQIKGIVDALRTVQDTVKQSIGQFIDQLKLVQDLQKQGPQVQKNFDLISSGIVKIGFQFTEFQGQLIGINVQQLGNVITTFVGNLFGQKTTSVVDFVEIFITDFIQPLVDISKNMKSIQIDNLRNLSSITESFVTHLNNFSDVITKHQFLSTVTNLINVLNPLTWFVKTDKEENNIKSLIDSFLNDFLVPVYNTLQDLPTIDTSKTNNLTSLFNVINESFTIFSDSVNDISKNTTQFITSMGILFMSDKFKDNVKEMINHIQDTTVQSQLLLWNNFISLIFNSLKDFSETFNQGEIDTVINNFNQQITSSLSLFDIFFTLNDNFSELKQKHKDFSLKGMWKGFQTFIGLREDSEIQEIIKELESNITSIIEFGKTLQGTIIGKLQNFNVNNTQMTSVSLFNGITQIISNMMTALFNISDIFLNIEDKNLNKVKDNITSYIDTYITIVKLQVGKLSSVDYSSLIKSYKEFRDNITKQVEGSGVSPLEIMNIIFSGFKLPVKEFQVGGFTGEGEMNEVQGVVHKGEYVIPSFLIDKYKTIIEKIEEDRLQYLKKHGKDLVPYQSGGQTFSLNVNRGSGVDFSSNTIYFLNELSIKNTKVKDIGTQIIMLQMSYMDKYGKEDKELREKMEKVVKSIVSTVIEQYSKDSFIKSLNDTLNTIFEKSPVINQEDIQKILIDQIKQMVSKIMEGVNNQILNLVNKTDVTSLSQTPTLETNINSMSNKIVELVGSTINNIINLLNVSKLLQSFQSFDFVDNILSSIFGEILPKFIESIISSTIVIGENINDTLEKNPLLRPQIELFYNSILDLFIYSFNILITSFSQSISIIQNFMNGILQNVLKLYLIGQTIMILTKIFTIKFPQIINSIIVSFVNQLQTTIEQYMKLTWEIVTQKIVPQKPDLNKKPEVTTQIQETITDKIQNFINGLNVFTSGVMGILLDTTSMILVDIGNFLSQDWVKNIVTTVEKIVLGLVIGVIQINLLKPSTWEFLISGIGQMFTQFGNIISNLLNQLSNLELSPDLGNKIVTSFVSFILKLFTNITNYLFSDEMIQDQSSLLQSDNLVLQQLGVQLPVMSVQIMGVLTYLLTSIQGSLSNLFNTLFSSSNIQQFQQDIQPENMQTIISSVVEGIFNIFSQVITGQMSLVSSSSQSSSGGLLGFFGGNIIGMVLDGLKIVIMGQMIWILGIMGIMISNVVPVISDLFKTLFSVDNIKRINPESKEYQDIVFSIVNQTTKFMFDLTMKVVDFQLGNNKSGGFSVNIISSIIGSVGSLIMTVMKQIIISKLQSILNIVKILFENVQTSISGIFKTLFSVDNISKINQSNENYSNLVFDIINKTIDFMFTLTIKTVEFQLSNQNNNNQKKQGFFSSLFSSISDTIMTVVKQSIISKLQSILDVVKLLFESVQSSISNIFKTLFKPEKVIQLQTGDNYVKLVTDIINTIIGFMINLTISSIDMQLNIQSGGGSKKKSGGGGLFSRLFGGGNESEDPIKKLQEQILQEIRSILKTVGKMFSNIQTQVGNIFGILFTVDNITKVQNNLDINQLTDLTLNIVNTMINFMIDFTMSLVDLQKTQLQSSKSKYGGFGVGFLFSAFGNLLRNTIGPLFSNIGTSIQLIFSTLFSTENISKVQEQLFENNKMSDIVTSIISGMIKLMVDSISSLMSNIGHLKELMIIEDKKRSWWDKTFGGKSSLSKFNEQVQSIFSIIQSNLSRISGIQVNLINKIFSKTNIDKYLSEDVLKDIIGDIIKQLIGVLFSPLFGLMSDSQKSQLLNTDIVVGVRKEKLYVPKFLRSLFPKLNGMEYEVKETKKLSEVIQEKTANMMKTVSNSIMKQMDKLSDYLKKSDFDLSFVQQFDQSIENLSDYLSNLITNSVNFDLLTYELDYNSQKIRFKVETINNLKNETENLKLELMNEQNTILSDIRQEIIKINQKLDNLQVSTNTNTSSDNHFIEKISMGI